LHCTHFFTGKCRISNFHSFTLTEHFPNSRGIHQPSADSSANPSAGEDFTPYR
jgi:hypothetical protein